MTRSSFLWISLFALGCVTAVSYATSTSIFSGDLKAERKTELNANTESANASRSELSEDREFFSQEFEANAVTVTVNNPKPSVAKLIADVNAEDSDTRAAAIDALAKAPKSSAAPVLQALLSASAHEDRQLALNSLYALALNQGDDDGAIRNVFRQTIYDGDDGELAVNAQLALDDLERDLGQAGPKSASTN